MTATSTVRELIPGWREDELPLHDKLDRELLAARLSVQRGGASRADAQLRRAVHHALASRSRRFSPTCSSTRSPSPAGCSTTSSRTRSSRSPTSRREFGKEIAAIVDGLTKIAKLPTGGSTQERQVESYRKLLLSIAKDARVIIVKLADRLHNMRTLDWLPPEKRRRIAQETRDLYAPLAHRFGMAKLRWELEDLAFKHLETDEYKALAKQVAQKRGEREALDRSRWPSRSIARLDEAGHHGRRRHRAGRSTSGRSTRR